MDFQHRTDSLKENMNSLIPEMQNVQLERQQGDDIISDCFGKDSELNYLIGELDKNGLTNLIL